ncbi:MAG: hypothetical protein ACM32E_33405 [Gemmatimonadota bacterium]
MRWVVVTPTFVAGLGVVVAAALSAPTRNLTLSTKPFKGTPCATVGCVPNGKGTLATGPKPKRIVIPARIPTPGAAQGQNAARSGQNVLVQYQTVGQDGSGDFIGRLVLASPAGRPLGSWVLRFGYPGEIRWVWGRPPLPPGQHSVTITSVQYSQSRWSGSGSHEVQIVFSVSGQQGPPAICTVNGSACHFTSFGGHSYSGPDYGGYGG